MGPGAYGNANTGNNPNQNPIGDFFRYKADLLERAATSMDNVRN